MEHSTHELLPLFVIFLAALVGGNLARVFKLPSVVGEIATGCLIGPSFLGFVTINEPLEILAEVGAVLLLFSVGLETRLGDLRKVGFTAILVGVCGVIVPFVLGIAWGLLSGFENYKAMFIASAFVATSAGITAKVLQELGVLQHKESRVILGAAVIDDILAMLLLGVVSALQNGKGVDIAQLSLVFLQALAFIFIVSLVGSKFMKKSSRFLEKPADPLSPLTLSLALCLGLAVAASYLGLAAIIGAFLAGMVLAEADQRHSLERQIEPILAFTVPFFFVVTGAKVDISQLSNLNTFIMVVVVTALAVVSKLIGCGFGALSLGKRGALIVGVGMVPRGEVGVIVASLGLNAAILTNQTYSVIIVMSLLTSVIAPPILKIMFRNELGKPSF